MHESIRSVRWGWVGFGWFMSAAAASAVLLALEAFGILAEGAPGEALWVAISIVVGFFAVGVFVGTRVAAAPILHGLAMGLLSLVAWFVVNLVVGEPLGESAWWAVDPAALAGLLVLQAAAAAVGARIGVRWVRRGTGSA